MKGTHKFLNLALELYLEYTLEDNYPDLIHIASLVDIKEKESNSKIILDTLHHTTLQDLGLEYLTRSKDKDGFVMYLHNMLNIRLTDMVSDEAKFDERCLDMALTLFDLSRYFLANNRFAEAKSHIAVGNCVICKLAADTSKTAEKESKASFHLYNENYDYADYAFAVSAKSWGFYGVSLLRFWIEKFSQSFEEQRDNQIKLHKGRIKLLEDARKKFHRITEDDRESQIYKRIWYEVVTSCSTIMDLRKHYDESFKEMSMKAADQYAKIIADN
ncbi:uncharacterized protein LOC112452971, partial [Temnothorax curvispinosus]|uniref:Uncharacterized protein LOC112452971 n=1 Tax=Temnothorax curvispinosus TaxID=300111 RepID=A0A6J1PI00_9HYME